MCCYAAVAGWCIKYLFDTAQNSAQIISGTAAQEHFDSFANSPLPVLFQFVSLAIAAIIVTKGAVVGIARANQISIPTLFVILLLELERTLIHEGASDGMSFIFTANPAQFADVNLWLEALTQSAWSTGAGCGLIPTYGAYCSKK
ncbi:MAG: sodium-dependent transporter [Deltaproteobacteria bacterium]|nr:sodium-dependent transporter [Deltaproteobacteria bacterium]